jgi:hypothetical protein
MAKYRRYYYSQKVLIPVCLEKQLVLSLHAEGIYYVGRDEGGVNFPQTDDHSSYYINELDVKGLTNMLSAKSAVIIDLSPP